ncbi:hypothetical protein A3K63_00890 [Candidatus Micrarchaeota archaeon RBG_16_49_10]|nr:MAG: hypothetical protein A3K63_00890 [Candidatus Micrarchaeota archaeon RBG_16_49_10]
MSRYDCVILGAGMAGLVAAYRLSKRGKKVLLVEKTNELGGLLMSTKTRGDPIEKYYHHVFVNNPSFINLAEEIGIENIIWTGSTLGFYTKGKIHDLSTPFSFIGFKILTVPEKIRLGLVMAKIKFIRNPKKLDDMTAKEWILNNAGKGVYEKFFSPMLKSKYDKNADKVSATWFIERIRIRTTGGFKKESLGYIDGGFHIFIDKIEQEILENGGDIVKGKGINKFIIRNGVMKGVVLDGKEINANNVISTIPLPTLAEYKDLSVEFRKKISDINYQGALCIIVGLDRKVTDFYWINIIDESLIGAIIEHTNFQSIEKYKDHILYLASYPDFRSHLWKLSDKGIFEEYFKELRRLFPYIKRQNLKWWKVSKSKKAGIIYETNYQKKVIGHETPVKGFYIGGMFNGYPERSIENSVIAGEELAKLCD